MGRPPGKTFDRSLKIHMSSKMIAQLSEEAKEQESNMSEITRRAVRFYLASKKHF